MTIRRAWATSTSSSSTGSLRVWGCGRSGWMQATMTSGMSSRSSLEEYQESATAALPENSTLHPNFPNPFNPVTTIEYALPHAGFVSLKVFDLIGKEVARLVHEEQQAGNHRVVFDAVGLPTGTYFAVLRADGHTLVQKMALVK